jgi:hypothetical protein
MDQWRTVIAAALLLAAAGCGRGADEGAPLPAALSCPGCDVVLVTVDALRADALPCYGGRRDGPGRICGLAARGVLFDRAITSATITWPALEAVMTGVQPANEPVEAEASLRTKPTLAEKLAAEGYVTAAFVDHPQIRFEGPLAADNDVLGRGFAFRQNLAIAADMGAGAAASTGAWPAPTAARLTDEALRFWDSARGRKRFMWLHYFDAHMPYTPTDGDARRAGFDLAACGWKTRAEALAAGDDPSPTQAEAACLRRLYEAEVAATDAQIGRLAEHVAPGRGERTALVVTADHGEAFAEHGKLGHKALLYIEALHVPLVIRTPGTLEQGPARHRDVLSTRALFDIVLGMVHGALPRTEPRAFARAGIGLLEGKKDTQRFALVTGEASVIFSDRAGASPELYDLVRDPRERTSVPNDPRAARLVSELRTWIGEHTFDVKLAPADAARVRDERERQLKALGYVDDGATTRR